MSRIHSKMLSVLLLLAVVVQLQPAKALPSTWDTDNPAIFQSTPSGTEFIEDVKSFIEVSYSVNLL